MLFLYLNLGFFFFFSLSFEKYLGWYFCCSCSKYTQILIHVVFNYVFSFLIIFSFQCANSALCLPRKLFSISEMTIRAKMELFLILGTKSSENKIQGPNGSHLKMQGRNCDFHLSKISFSCKILQSYQMHVFIFSLTQLEYHMNLLNFAINEEL